MIIVAMNNNMFFNKIKEKYNGDVYDYDIIDMESVISLINKLKIKYDELILITKDSLEGRFTKELYIKQIRLVSDKIKVILLTENLDEEFKKFLFANEIFNIIESKIIDIEKVIENIEDNNKVIYKITNKKNNINIKEKEVKYTNVPKQIISIFGTNGSGKSYISSIISKLICEKEKNKIITLDFDLCNSSIDIINSLDNNSGNLMNIIYDIDLGKNIKESFKNNIIQKNGNNYLINNVSIYDYQNKLNTNYYNKVLTEVKEDFNFVLIDLPSNPFIDIVPFSLLNSDKIFFVINPNYISIRQAIKYLNLMIKLWKIDKKKIYLIINKKTKDSLNDDQIKKILLEIDILLEVEYDKKLESTINGGGLSIINQNIDTYKLFKELGMINENLNFKEKIFNIFKEKKIAYDN